MSGSIEDNEIITPEIIAACVRETFRTIAESVQAAADGSISKDLIIGVINPWVDDCSARKFSVEMWLRGRPLLWLEAVQKIMPMLMIEANAALAWNGLYVMTAQDIYRSIPGSKLKDARPITLDLHGKEDHARLWLWIEPFSINKLCYDPLHRPYRGAVLSFVANSVQTLDENNPIRQKITSQLKDILASEAEKHAEAATQPDIFPETVDADLLTSLQGALAGLRVPERQPLVRRPSLDYTGLERAMEFADRAGRKSRDTLAWLRASAAEEALTL